MKDREHVSLNHLLGLSSVCSAKNSLQIITAFIHHLSFSIYEGGVKGNVWLGPLSLVCLSAQIWPRCTHVDKIVHIRRVFLSSRCSFRDFYRERKFSLIIQMNFRNQWGFFSYVWLTEEKWTVPIHPSCIIEMVCNLQQTPENTLSQTSYLWKATHTVLRCSKVENLDYYCSLFTINHPIMTAQEQLSGVNHW